MKNIIKSKGERKMELYILMGLAAVIIILEAVILLKAKKDDGREQDSQKNEQNFRRMGGLCGRRISAQQKRNGRKPERNECPHSRHSGNEYKAK